MDGARAVAAASDRDPFDVLTDLADASPPGANRLLFLPYMYGERSPIWDTEARGAYVGLSLASTKGDMVRAIMEGAAFGLRHNVDAAERQAHNALRLTCVGGAARSPLWNQIKADILQVPIHVPSTTGGAPLGDVILAATAAGLYPNIESAIDHMTRPGKIYEPNPALAARYDALYAVYLNLYPALSDSFEALAAVAES